MWRVCEGKHDRNRTEPFFCYAFCSESRKDSATRFKRETQTGFVVSSTRLSLSSAPLVFFVVVVIVAVAVALVLPCDWQRFFRDAKSERTAIGPLAVCVTSKRYLDDLRIRAIKAQSTTMNRRRPLPILQQIHGEDTNEVYRNVIFLLLHSLILKTQVYFTCILFLQSPQRCVYK